MAKKKIELDSSGMEIPAYQFEAFARCLLPKIQQYYESEAGQQAFEQWKVKQKSDVKNNEN